MPSFVREFKKYQRQERLLTGIIFLSALLAPISYTWLMNKKIHPLISGGVAIAFVVAAAAIHIVRNRVAQKLVEKYQHLDVGYVLSKKLAPAHSARRFVITDKAYNHYYLKCLNTGEKILVSKHRVREDFDIAN